MRLPLFQVDAFTSRLFGGNPAAVVLLDRWLPDATLQAVAAENNLSETAFVVPEGADYRLRWLTPTVEVDLCGHATLAAGYVLLQQGGTRIVFHTRSGALVVRRDGDVYWLDLPALPPMGAVDAPEVVAALGRAPLALRALREVHHGRYLLAEYAHEDEIRALTPDVRALGAARTNVVATAPGLEVDFVSRFFAPASGVDEDPVTGSAHASLAPMWAERLGRTDLWARQLSRRGGELRCVLDGDRVRLGGHAVLYLEGRIHLPDRLG